MIIVKKGAVKQEFFVIKIQMQTVHVNGYPAHFKSGIFIFRKGPKESKPAVNSTHRNLKP